MVRVVPIEERTSVLHIGRTTLAAVISQLVAHSLHMPEPYWATVTTIVVMQSTLGAAWKVSVKRFAGTALGAFMGGLIASYLPAGIVVFAATLFVTGLICLALGLDRTAYRFAGITEVIVMLVVRERVAWIIATHRFIEVSLGILVALIVTAAWPERLDPALVSEVQEAEAKG
jgi:uncharacterized membrane protein YgaE (UPF0421/DUF939 family)